MQVARSAHAQHVSTQLLCSPLSHPELCVPFLASQLCLSFLSMQLHLSCSLLSYNRTSHSRASRCNCASLSHSSRCNCAIFSILSLQLRLSLFSSKLRLTFPFFSLQLRYSFSSLQMRTKLHNNYFQLHVSLTATGPYTASSFATGPSHTGRCLGRVFPCGFFSSLEVSHNLQRAFHRLGRPQVDAKMVCYKLELGLDALL